LLRTIVHCYKTNLKYYQRVTLNRHNKHDNTNDRKVIYDVCVYTVQYVRCTHNLSVCDIDLHTNDDNKNNKIEN
jgi:hypothetical protein